MLLRLFDFFGVAVFAISGALAGIAAQLDLLGILVLASVTAVGGGTIRDLIAYRLRHDHMAEMRAEARFHSRWGGDWTAKAFYNSATGTEQIVLQKGHVTLTRLVNARVLRIFDGIKEKL